MPHAQNIRRAAPQYSVFCLLALRLVLPGLHASPKQPVEIRHAQRFSIERRADCTLLTVTEPWRTATCGFVYALVPRGARAPADVPAEAAIVRVPVRRIVLLSSSFVPYFDSLGLTDRIVGVSDGSSINTPSVASSVATGAIAEVGSGGGMASGVNIEKLFMLQPDLVMTYGTGNAQFDNHGKLMEAGFTVAMNAEYMETTPLARAEWIRFIAAFFAVDARAGSVFDGIEKAYNEAAALAATVTTRPTVFCNIDFQGTWHMAGGRSYLARFLRDAGADYLWKDNTASGGVPIAVEAIIARAQNADVWLNPGSCDTLDAIEAIDERYRLFRALRTGRVYSNTARMSEGGGNDYWETGVANPHLVLRDLVKIFHPSLLPDHALVWHRKLERRKR